jgi:hypothetical protein
MHDPNAPELNKAHAASCSSELSSRQSPRRRKSPRPGKSWLICSAAT